MILTLHSFFNVDISALRAFTFPTLIKDEVIDLSRFQHFFPNIDLMIFIREEYVTAMKKWSESSTGFMLLGSPGIGKSTFGRLLLCLLISQKKKVIYWHSTYDSFIFEDNSAKLFNLSSLNTISTSDSFVIYDDKRGFQNNFGDRKFGKFLIIHSPSADTNNSLKAVGFNGARWIMNPASLNECISISVKCSWEIEDNTIIERFEIVGGLFRYLKFEKESLLVQIDDGCIKISSDLSNIVNMNQLHSASDKICHRVIHWRRIDDYKFSLEFGSDYIEQKVIKLVSTSSDSSLIKLANSVDINGSLRGDIFENRMHFSFSSFKKFEFKTKSLPYYKEAGGEEDIVINTTHSISFSKLSDIKEKKVNNIFN